MPSQLTQQPQKFSLKNNSGDVIQTWGSWVQEQEGYPLCYAAPGALTFLAEGLGSKAKF